MRIGEIRNTISRVLNENNQIEVKQDGLYGGQAQQVNNYGLLVEALEIVIDQAWNKIDPTPIKEIINKHGKDATSAVLSVDEFNALNSYVNSINSQMPLYFSVIQSLTDHQEEKAVNIQLPLKIRSFDDLNQLNKRLNEIFKLVNIDGEFEFCGFDKGTDWYTFCSLGILTHTYLFACLRVAQQYLKTRTEYFKSEEARISYEASLKSEEQDSGESFEKYKERWLERFVEIEVKKVIDSVKQTNGKTIPELQSQLVKATTKLVQELGEGVEFHLSLNPPEYAQEQGGQLVIDYKKIQSLMPKEEPRQLGDKKNDLPKENEK